MDKIELASLKKTRCLVFCILMLAPIRVRAADTPAIRLLLNRAQTQAQSGHLDIAIATWKQVLAADPENKEALVGLATASVQTSHQAEAKIYLERLRRAGGSAAVIGKIQAIAPQPSNDVMLRDAARLTQAGKYADAIAIYRKLYGNNPPAGQTALTYYDTLAALPAERKHAIEDLRRLSQQFRGDERYAITLGRVLTYDAPTRAEGIAILQKYPNSQPAQEAIHQAKEWNERGQRTTSIEAIKTAPAATPPSEVALGYRALNAENLTVAESHFQASLAHEAAKKDAYAGLGYVRMRQQDFPSAVHEFEQAKQNGNRDPKMNASLETARFWTLMATAGKSADNGQFDEAISDYRKALTLKPGNVDALTGLGGTLLRTDQPTEAIPYLSQATQTYPGGNNSQAISTAWRLLFLAQSQASLYYDAIQTAEHIPVQLHSHFEQDPEFLGALAADYMATGNQTQGEKLLRQALAPFQNETKKLTTAQRLQYASLLIAARHYNTAVLTYQRVLADSPENIDAWRGLINAEHQNDRDAEALATLRQMPSDVSSALGRDAGFLALIASVYQSQEQFEAARTALDRAQKIAPSTNLALQRASLEMVSGNHSAAVRLYSQLVEERSDNTAVWLGLLESLHTAGQDREALHKISAMPEEVGLALEQNPEFLQTLASVYNSIGDRGHAMAALTRLESVYAERGEMMPPAASLQEGWLLLQNGDNAHLARLIQSLAADSLNTYQQNQLAQLWANWAIQRSSALVRSGNSAAAENVLAAALRAFPDNIEVNNALASAYLQNGNAKQAVLLYARQDLSKADKSVCLAAINAALAANDRGQSEKWLTSALNRFGHDPKILELAARFEQQRGDRRKAAAYYRAALQSIGPPSVDDLLGPTAPANPGGTQVSAREELFQMLAPNSIRPSNATTNHQESLWPLISDSSIPASNAPSSKRTRTEDTRLLPLPIPTENRPRSPSNAESIENILPLPAPQNIPATPSHPSAVTRNKQFDSAPSAQPFPESAPQRSSDSSDFVSSQRMIEPLRDQSKLQSLIAPESPISQAMIEQVPIPQLAPLPSLTDKTSASPPLPPSPSLQIQQNLEAIESATSSALGGDSSVGFHSGQPGFDRLTIFGTNVVQSIGIGTGARLSIITHPVLLENPGPQANATLQLGSLPLGALPAAQNSAGVGGEIQLRTRSFGAALGYTPYGFLVSNITGRFSLQPDAGPITFTFERQPIEDSQLSYAGLLDPGSIGPTYAGNIWGGVIANAGSLQMSRGGATSGWYAQMGGQYLTGRHVQNNFRIDGDAGAYWSIWQRPEYGKLTLGMNFFGMHYDNNQRQFTYGNGGYFSPGAYLLSSVPFTFEGVHGPRFHYRLATSLGLQAFQEGSSPFFPLDPALQNSKLGGYLVEHSDIGANYNIEGETSYLINEHWHINGFFSLNNTRGYNNDRVGFSLRYAFHPQPLNLLNGPTGLGGSTGLRPPVLP